MIRRDVGTAVAAAVATLLGAVALTPVFRSGSWFGPVLATVVVVLTGGLLLRAAGPALWARVSGGRPVPQRLSAVGVPLVPVGQLALVCCLLTALYAPDAALAGVVPTPTSLAALADVLADGAVQMQEQSTPALPLHGLVALSVVLVGFVAVAVDLVAVAGGQPALAGLGLLVPYCVPVSTITGGIGLVALAAPAAGLALLLWADQHRRLARRPRPGRRSVLGTGGLVAVRTGALALVAGLVLGAVVPTLAEGALTGGTGDGPGGGATGTALDPVAEMRGQLTLPDPIDLLSVTASVDDPGYLRAVTLDRYDARSGWTLTSLDGDASIAGDGSLAPLPDGEPSRAVDATITALQHDDRFLPLPYSPQSVSVDGGDDRGWRFDPATSTVFGRGTTTAGQSWRVDAEEPEPTVDLLEASPALPATSSVLARYTALPALDPSVTALVAQLTDGLGTPYERVRAIHGYLTDRANGFVYSLSTAPGTSGDDLADFLRLRRGYCEQYAGAMAVLVRAAGVPARVALGYTPGATEPDGTRLITSDDAHAWVEVYFDGLGWVPFDPTPIEPARAVILPWAPRGDAAPTPDETAATPTTVAPSLPAPTLSNGETDTSITLGSAADDAGSVLGPLLLGTGAVLLVVALLAAPATARALQRRRRLADGSPGALWDELAATALDLGIALHASATPRQAARHLAELVARGDGGGVHRRGVRRPDDGTAAADALRCLALAEETASYARPGAAVASAELGEALRTARRGLLRGAARSDRLRARLWPVSLLRGSGRRGAEAVGRWLRAAVRRRTSAA